MTNFDVNKLSGDDAKAIVRNLLTPFQATIQRQQSSSEKIIEELTIDLSVARTRANALKVSFPFVSLRIEQATDIQTNCNIIPTTIDEFQKGVKVKLNDTLEFDNGISSVFITNDAQPNKIMVIKFFTQGRVRSGSLVLDQNSVPTNLKVGNATALNDGFSYVLEANFSSAPSAAVGVQWLGAFFATNDYSLNEDTNTITINSFTYQNQFKVPKGYTAEVVGCETEVTNTLPNGVICLLNAHKNNSVHTNDLSAATFGVSKFGDNSKKAITITQPYIFNPVCSKNSYPYSSGNFNPRLKNIFYENELIVPFIYTIAGTGGSCQGTFRILVRLTKNVEA